MFKRTLALFCFLIFCFFSLIVKISTIGSSSNLLQAAQQQSSFTLTVAETRGTIYDKNMVPLTNATSKNIAAVSPSPQSADALMRETPLDSRPTLQEKLTALSPFLWQVKSDVIYAKGVEVFSVPNRYQDIQPAAHIIGQIDYEQNGVSGLELAYNSLLENFGGNAIVKCFSDALGRSSSNSVMEVEENGYNSKGGLVLTLDKEIQQIVETAGSSLEKGAIVVMDPYSGELVASASFPTFNPNMPELSLNDENSPFFNRAFAPFSVGSTFKLLTAATALENNISPNRNYTCLGAIDVSQQIFKCHNLQGHGTIDMTTALNRSCNPYFISLALEIGGGSLLYKAQQLGFGSRLELAPGYYCAGGTLPDAKELIAPAATGNFGFGQGVLTATPVQMATLVSSIANGGYAVTPRLVKGSTQDGKSISSSTVAYSPTQVFATSAAQQVYTMMIDVVENGSGKNAKPNVGGAGGKTASAQSGQFEDGVEIVHAWFCGFYPANQPRYVIVVLAEGGNSGSDVACPIFKEIADGIYNLEES